mmetsp:Transcript_16762/g.48258  ORF Transcript_16762/g.48258 Transcript_16762/m.48258 type:complete len:333 (-) Transcript_16762:1309-2307(-)
MRARQHNHNAIPMKQTHLQTLTFFVPLLPCIKTIPTSFLLPALPLRSSSITKAARGSRSCKVCHILVLVPDQEQRVPVPARHVRDDAGVQLLHELGLGRRLGSRVAIPQLPVGAIPPADRDTVLGRAEDCLRTPGEAGHDVTIVHEDVHEGRAHGRLPDAPVFPPVVHVSVGCKGHGALRPRGSPNRAVGRKEGAAEGCHEAGGVLVGLNAVAEAAVPPATPRENAGWLAGRRPRLDCNSVIPTARDTPDGNVGRVLQGDHLFLLSFLTPGGKAAFGVELALHKEGAALELGRVSEAHLVGRDEIFSRRAVAQLAELGEACCVYVTLGGEED